MKLSQCNTVARDDYSAVTSNVIQFNVGDVRVMHTIRINQDQLCETDPDEYFFSNITLNSDMQPINVIEETAIIIIDDSAEPECSKSHLFPLNTYIDIYLNVVLWLHTKGMTVVESHFTLVFCTALKQILPPS